MGRLLRIEKKVYLSWRECLEDFIIYKSAQGFADRTIEDYKWHITHFFKDNHKAWCDTLKLKKAVVKYFADGRHLAPATHNIRRKYLKAFFTWTVQEGILTLNPMDGISIRREEPRVREIDNEKLKSLLSFPDKTTYSGIRDYALLCFSLDTGIRPKEALCLYEQNFNLSGMEVNVPAVIAKTRVSRTLPLTQLTVESLKSLIAVRPLSWKKTPLFSTAEGKPMTTSAWTKRLGYYGKILGFKVSPYDLRHVFALMFLRNGGHALALQRTMGHTDLSMTKRYVALTQQDLREQHTIASPLNVLMPKKERLRKLKV